jgi:hypothetical protein
MFSAAVLVACGIGLSAVAPLAAQLPIDAAALERLETIASDVDADIARMGTRDSASAATLRAELTEAREDITYLRVVLRREGRVSRDAYEALQSKLIDVQRRAQIGSVEAGPYTVPVGTELDVRIQSGLSSGTAVVEDSVSATTIADLRRDGRVLIPAGSIARGIVTNVEKAGRVHRKGSLTLQFERMTIDGRTYDLQATVTEAIESEGLGGEKAKIGTSAGVGAVIGGILGGFKGALAGILIGAGGIVAATDGEDVELEPGTILRIRIDSALRVEPVGS